MRTIDWSASKNKYTDVNVKEEKITYNYRPTTYFNL